MSQQILSVGECRGRYMGTLRQVSPQTLLLEKISSLKEVRNVSSERCQLLSWWMYAG